MTEPDMQLPPGMTCADCRHMPRCEWLISREGHETECDWAPSRFAPKVTGVASKSEPSNGEPKDIPR